MSTTNLSGNPYVSFILSAIVEIPSYIIAVFVVDLWGRKPFCAFCLLLSGVCCIPSGYAQGTFQTVLVLIGKFGASGAFAVIYLYTAELYPTAIRSSALGLCSMMARIGGIAAPQVTWIRRIFQTPF